MSRRLARRPMLLDRSFYATKETMALYPKKNIDVQVPLQVGKSNHVDIGSLIRLSEEVQEPAVLKFATSESPERFQVVRVDPKPQETEEARVETAENPRTDSPQTSKHPLDHAELLKMGPEAFLTAAEMYSVEELSKTLGLVAASIRGRIKRYLPLRAAAEGRPEDEVKAEFDERRLSSGALTARGYTHAVAKRRCLKRKAGEISAS